LLAYGAEDCPTYGVCRAHTKGSVANLVKALIGSGYLRAQGTEYPTLDVTLKGREVAQGFRTLVLEQTGNHSPDRVKKPDRSRAAPMPTSPPERQLVERLRRLRSQLAEEEGVAPFLIFHDRTLKAIACSKPETPAALLEIPGIGEMKADRYGRRVLDVVNGDL
ncbi:MAG TPA: HRDC domain-containing protein, partial [Nitrospira sp.]|nr:HRDC domain-containing protein [Nitrospira sp.]